jgi:hypothetical protein
MNIRNLLSAAAILGAALLETNSANAATLTCRDRIVSSGDTQYEVRSVCGEPDASARRVEYRTVRRPGGCINVGGRVRCGSQEVTIEITVDEWTYDFGSNRFIQFVTFEDGRLVRVDSGGYGRKSR